MWSRRWRSGSDAEQLTSAEHFDAVICDLNLGADSGLELLRHLNAAGDCTPFILFTGNTDQAYEVSGRRFTALLSKPCVSADLRLERVTGRRLAHGQI